MYAYFSCKSIGGHRNDGMSGGRKRGRKKQKVGQEGEDRERRGRDDGEEVRGVRIGGVVVVEMGMVEEHGCGRGNG